MNLPPSSSYLDSISGVKKSQILGLVQDPHGLRNDDTNDDNNVKTSTFSLKNANLNGVSTSGSTLGGAAAGASSNVNAFNGGFNGSGNVFSGGGASGGATNAHTSIVPATVSALSTENFLDNITTIQNIGELERQLASANSRIIQNEEKMMSVLENKRDELDARDKDIKRLQEKIKALTLEKSELAMQRDAAIREREQMKSHAEKSRKQLRIENNHGDDLRNLVKEMLQQAEFWKARAGDTSQWRKRLTSVLGNIAQTTSHADESESMAAATLGRIPGATPGPIHYDTLDGAPPGQNNGAMNSMLNPNNTMTNGWERPGWADTVVFSERSAMVKKYESEIKRLQNKVEAMHKTELSLRKDAQTRNSSARMAGSASGRVADNKMVLDLCRKVKALQGQNKNMLKKKEEQQEYIKALEKKVLSYEYRPRSTSRDGAGGSSNATRGGSNNTTRRHPPNFATMVGMDPNNNSASGNQMNAATSYSMQQIDNLDLVNPDEEDARNLERRIEQVMSHNGLSHQATHNSSGAALSYSVSPNSKMFHHGTGMGTGMQSGMQNSGLGQTVISGTGISAENYSGIIHQSDEGIENSPLLQSFNSIRNVPVVSGQPGMVNVGEGAPGNREASNALKSRWGEANSTSNMEISEIRSNTPSPHKIRPVIGDKQAQGLQINAQSRAHARVAKKRNESAGRRGDSSHENSIQDLGFHAPNPMANAEDNSTFGRYVRHEKANLKKPDVQVYQNDSFPGSKTSSRRAGQGNQGGFVRDGDRHNTSMMSSNIDASRQDDSRQGRAGNAGNARARGRDDSLNRRRNELNVDKQKQLKLGPGSGPGSKDMKLSSSEHSIEFSGSNHSSLLNTVGSGITSAITGAESGGVMTGPSNPGSRNRKHKPSENKKPTRGNHAISSTMPAGGQQAFGSTTKQALSSAQQGGGALQAGGALHDPSMLTANSGMGSNLPTPLSQQPITPITQFNNTKLSHQAMAKSTASQNSQDVFPTSGLNLDRHVDSAYANRRGDDSRRDGNSPADNDYHNHSPGGGSPGGNSSFDLSGLEELTENIEKSLQTTGRSMHSAQHSAQTGANNVTNNVSGVVSGANNGASMKNANVSDTVNDLSTAGKSPTTSDVSFNRQKSGANTDIPKVATVAPEALTSSSSSAYNTGFGSKDTSKSSIVSPSHTSPVKISPSNLVEPGFGGLVQPSERTKNKFNDTNTTSKSPMGLNPLKGPSSVSMMTNTTSTVNPTATGMMTSPLKDDSKLDSKFDSKFTSPESIDEDIPEIPEIPDAVADDHPEDPLHSAMLTFSAGSKQNGDRLKSSSLGGARMGSNNLGLISSGGSAMARGNTAGVNTADGKTNDATPNTVSAFGLTSSSSDSNAASKRTNQDEGSAPAGSRGRLMGQTQGGKANLPGLSPIKARPGFMGVPGFTSDDTGSERLTGDKKKKKEKKQKKEKNPKESPPIRKISDLSDDIESEEIAL